MTGYESKKAAALDEDGMYLVHHTKRKDDDDDIQVYKRTWVGIPEEDLKQGDESFFLLLGEKGPVGQMLISRKKTHERNQNN
jgi:hypothetical protein